LAGGVGEGGLQDAGDIGAVDGLALEQFLGDGVERRTVLAEDLHRRLRARVLVFRNLDRTRPAGEDVDP